MNGKGWSVSATTNGRVKAVVEVDMSSPYIGLGVSVYPGTVVKEDEGFGILTHPRVHAVSEISVEHAEALIDAYIDREWFDVRHMPYEVVDHGSYQVTGFVQYDPQEGGIIEGTYTEVKVESDDT